MENEKKTLDCWGVVELMGHQRIAGRITEKNVAGTQMLQVDVPAMGDVPGYTRLMGGAAIYAINPTDEETATGWAKSIATSASPILSWDGKGVVDRMVEKRLAALPTGEKKKECRDCANEATIGELCASCHAEAVSDDLDEDDEVVEEDFDTENHI